MKKNFGIYFVFKDVLFCEGKRQLGIYIYIYSLNTGEQKDMAEFFIDLLFKTEEMTPELKEVVKSTFCGQLSNNVVSSISTSLVTEQTSSSHISR